jgi:hypothetical protein
MTRRLATLGILAVALIGARPAAAARLVFIDLADEVEDEDWSQITNWWNLQNSENELPEATDLAYVTSFWLLPEPTAVIETSFVDTGPLYVGGWEAAADAELGTDSADHAGTLEIRDGIVTLHTTPGGSPPCHYLRVGSRGARGTIRQTGGLIRGCTFFSFGFYAPDTVGIWHLDGGTIETYGLDIGVMGTGLLDVQGGIVKPLSSPIDGVPIPGGNGIVQIGTGYHLPETGYQPGVGVVTQSGGEFLSTRVEIGQKLGTVGTLSVHAAADFRTDALEVGPSGTGAIVQTGGLLEADSVVLGRSPDGLGVLTISGGTLRQTLPSSFGLYNGYSEASPHGVGRMTIIGAAAEIDLTGTYYQNHLSRLTVMLDAPAPHIAPIVTAGQAYFGAGAIVDVEIVKDQENDPVLTPAVEQVFRLVESHGSGILNAGLALAAEDTGDWKLRYTSEYPGPALDVLSVVYCPGFAASPTCDGSP